jgi:hypothetical protein
MGNLNGPWTLGWTGNTTSLCSDIPLVSHADDIYRIFQVNPSGTLYISQEVDDAADRFSVIKNFECGSGVVVRTINASADVPGIIESASSSNLVIPSFPMEIEIDGLDGEYIQGNGVYHITTFFTENSPTYKSGNGWTIRRQPDGRWYIDHGIVGLGKLTGPSEGPTDGAYVLIGCEVNCPQGRPTNPASDHTPTPQPAPTPTPPPVSELGLNITHTSDTTINVDWSSTAPDIKNYFIELSTAREFTTATQFVIEPTTTSFEFKELSPSTSYFLRIRLLNQNEIYSGWDTISTNTTIPANTTNPSVTLTHAKRPKLSWVAPSVAFGYLVSIEKSTNGNNWSQLQVISDTSIVEFKDESVVDEGVYYYRLIFKTGNFSGTPSDSMKVVVDRTAPPPPVLAPNDFHVASSRLNFSWSSTEDIKRYLYKFNTSSWIGITEESVSISGIEGENIFRLKSVDQSENISTEVWQRINVDLTDPIPPILISPNSPTSNARQTYSWNSTSPDLEAHAYRLNLGVWKKLDKSVKDVTLELSQGLNTFEIKAIDRVLRESEVISSFVRVDSIPPDSPELIHTDVNKSDRTLKWSWSGTPDVAKYQYRFTTWDFDDIAAELNWSDLSSQVFEKLFPADDGYNRFEIRAVDATGNISLPASQTVPVDFSPPTQPTLKTPVISNDGDPSITFSWELSSDTKHVRFRLNSGNWYDEDNSVVTTSLPAKQGLNIFEIYALDVAGNKSETNRVETFVDSIPPTKPVITGPVGECPAALWERLWTACQASLVGQPSSVKITYSFMPKNTLLYAPFDSGTAKIAGVRSEEPSSSNMPFSVINDETLSAFQDWKQIIELAFENVSIEFENRGIESGEQIPSATSVMHKKTNQGDIRIGFTSDIRTNSSDRAFDNQDQEFKTGVSDVYVDTSLNWKPDAEVDSDSYSFRFGMRHYIGKSLGLELNANSEGTSHKIEKAKSVATVETTEDKSHFYNTYAYPNVLGADSSLKVVSPTDVEVSWVSGESANFQWKYDFVGDSGEILTTSIWNTYSNGTSRGGNVRLDLDLTTTPSNAIRFYVRSRDTNINTSDESYVDIKIIQPAAPTSILSVTPACENNSEFMSGNNCWDKFGRFGCELQTIRTLRTDESPLIIVSPRDYSYDVITELGPDHTSSLLNVDSLPPSTKMEIRLVVRRQGEEFRYGPNSFSEYTANIGTVFTSSSLKHYTTTDSDIIPPTVVKINNPEHYKESDSTGFTHPTGERRWAHIYTPAVKLSWVADITFDFKETRIIYSDSVNFSNSETVVITDVNQDFVIISLKKYSTKYYFKIVSYDEYDNSSVSLTKSYTTVPMNHPPSYVDDSLTVTTTGDLLTRYNERPGYKWTLQFKLPSVLDRNYPGAHKLPDTEVPTRTDYTESDWMTLLGHLPYKIEILNSPGTSTGTWTTFWLSRNTIHDIYQQTITDLNLYIKNDRICFKMRGFEAAETYTMRFTAYDATGHFTTRQYKFLTPVATGDTTAPPLPDLEVNQYRFLNGHTTNGESLKDKQWVLEFIWKIKETADLAKFYLWYKEASADSFVGGSAKLDALTKVTNAGVSSYTLRLSGFDSNTEYTVSTEAVDATGNMSDRTSFKLTTAVGDTTPPEKPMMADIRRYFHSQYGDSLVLKVRRGTESNLALHINVTTNLSETDIWKYEHKYILPAESLPSDNYFKISGLFKRGTVYKVAMAYRDYAYNWGPILYWQTPSNPEASQSNEIADHDLSISWESQTEFSDAMLTT